MVFLDPLPPEMASGSYYHTTAADYYLSPDKLAGDYSPVRFERELKFFSRACPSGAVLDVGCSTGGFLYQLQRRFPGVYRVAGTDASGPALDYAASQGIPVHRGDFLGLDFGGQKFDAITFWAVLEHLAEPARFLERARALLNPAGVCIVLVPNYKSLAIRLLGGRYRYVYEQHLNYFDRGTLKKLMAREFPNVQITSTHFNPLVIWQDWRSGGKCVSNLERGALLKKTNQLKGSPMMGPARLAYRAVEAGLVRLGLADNLAAVARMGPD